MKRFGQMLAKLGLAVGFVAGLATCGGDSNEHYYACTCSVTCGGTPQTEPRTEYVCAATGTEAAGEAKSNCQQQPDCEAPSCSCSCPQQGQECAAGEL